MIGMLAVCASLVVGPEAFDPNGNHIQGIAASEDALYVAQMTRLVKLDWTGKVLASRSVQSHTGDISWHDGELYTAVSVYPERKEGRIQVFDKDLNLVRETAIDRTIDGIAYAGGVLYVGMGAKTQPSKNPHRVNILGRFDAKTLKEIAPRAEFDYGYETRYGFQNIVFDGERLVGSFYAVPGSPGVVFFDKSLNILGTATKACNQGFDVLPPSMRRNGRRFVRAATRMSKDPAVVSCEFDFIDLNAAAVRTFNERLSAKTGGPFLIAHRGCQSLAPENTVASFVCAARLGLDAIETDVRLSKDGVLVCSHDASLKRMFGVKKKVSDLTADELREFVPTNGNCISAWPKEMLRIPTFAEYLDVCEKYDKVPFIETKGDVAVVKPVLDEVRRRGLAHVAVLSAISFDHIREARRLDKDIFIHHIFSSPELLDELSAMGNAGLSYNYKDLATVPDGLVERVHAKGVKMCLRAGDTPESVAKMRAMGLDYIPTNVTIPVD